MATYEIRLLNVVDDTVMIHITSCDSTDKARSRVAIIDGVAFDRFEIWHNGQKLNAGPNPKP